MRWFVVPYAYGLAGDRSGFPDTEGQHRCNVALGVARSLPNALIVLGAGMANMTTKRGVASLAAASQKYLTIMGWTGDKTLANPRGWDTVTETEAVLEAIGGSSSSTVVAVTTWYHAFRVWLVWLLHGRLVRLRVSWRMASRLNPLRELVAIPKSLIQAIWRKALEG